MSISKDMADACLKGANLERVTLTSTQISDLAHPLSDDQLGQVTSATN